MFIQKFDKASYQTAIKAFPKSWLSKLKFGSVFRSAENKLHLVEVLVVELSVLYVLFGKRKEQNGTAHFVKERVEKKTNKYP